MKISCHISVSRESVLDCSKQCPLSIDAVLNERRERAGMDVGFEVDKENYLSLIRVDVGGV